MEAREKKILKSALQLLRVYLVTHGAPNFVCEYFEKWFKKIDEELQ